MGQQFVVRTDQKTLKILLEQRVGTKAQQKWITKLLYFNFTIEYKKGKETSAANSLSRNCAQPLSEDGVLAMVTFPYPLWLEKVKSSYLYDVKLKYLLNKLERQEKIPIGYGLLNGLILRKGIILIVADSAFKNKLLHYVHNDPQSGHLGFIKTYQRAKKNFIGWE